VSEALGSSTEESGEGQSHKVLIGERPDLDNERRRGGNGANGVTRTAD
jgi:hypothetical protein